jgi:hypothetical protein
LAYQIERRRKIGSGARTISSILAEHARALEVASYFWNREQEQRPRCEDRESGGWAEVAKCLNFDGARGRATSPFSLLENEFAIRGATRLLSVNMALASIFTVLSGWI